MSSLNTYVGVCVCVCVNVCFKEAMVTYRKKKEEENVTDKAQFMTNFILLIFLFSFFTTKGG